MKKLFFLLMLTVFSASSFAQKTKADLIIADVNMIDVKTGKVKPDQYIIVRNDTIIGVFNQNKASNFSASKTMNAKGKFAIPGLWDMHVHFGGGQEIVHENKNLLPLYLAYGITTVRDCSADISNSVLQWREEIKKGQLMGPTVFTSGPKLEGYKSVWLGDIEISTSGEL